MSINFDTVTEAYVNTRNDIKSLEEKISELKTLQAKREEWMGEQLTKNGIDQMKGKHGTVFKTTFESVTVADKDCFVQWIKDNDRFDCIEARAAKAEILNIMGDREDGGRPNPPPPGVNVVAFQKINVRKA